MPLNKKTIDTQEIKDKILMQALADAPFDGWSEDMLARAVKTCGYEPEMARAVFPEGVSDLVAYFSTWADERMKEKISKIDPEDLKIRARVAKAVMARFAVLEPHKEALRAAAKYWARPFRSIKAQQMVWQTADIIWEWAGDTATDYNRYTKRGLLVTVIGSTTFYWLTKSDASMEDIDQFLRARIENVLKVGQAASKLKNVKSFTEAMPIKNFFKSPFSGRNEKV